MREDWQRLYKTARWQSLRRWKLQINPLCEISLALGETRAAEVVDHIAPHRGDVGRFFDAHNLMSVSKQVHDTICQQMECGTWTPPIGQDGWPIENEFLNLIAKIKRQNLQAGGRAKV